MGEAATAGTAIAAPAYNPTPCRLIVILTQTCLLGWAEFLDLLYAICGLFLLSAVGLEGLVRREENKNMLITGISYKQILD